MPIYEYSCQACGHVFEEIHGASVQAEPACPSCGAKKAKKLMSAAAFRCDEGGSLQMAGMPSAPAAPSGGCGGSGGFS